MARYGRVTFSVSYVVDMDDAEMIDEAREMLAEDVADAIRYREVGDVVEVEPDPNATEADIHDTLIQWRDERREVDRRHGIVLNVPESEATRVQRILDGWATSAEPGECFYERSVTFSDGCRMEVRAVRNDDGEGGWPEAVLFSPNGGELGSAVGDDDRLIGEYSVDVEREDGTHTYTVEVVSAVAAT